jgi:hypothetical protein
MRLTLFGLSLFLVTFLAHCLVWRVRVPRRAIRVLLVFFLAAPSAAALLVHALPALAPLAPASVWEWLHVAGAHIALSLAYIVTYSGLEEDSPSLTILVYLAEAAGAGRSHEELYGRIGDEFVIGSRLQALLAGGLVVSENGTYRLTARGMGWARLFGAFRWLYHLRPGG